MGRWIYPKRRTQCSFSCAEALHAASSPVANPELHGYVEGREKNNIPDGQKTPGLHADLSSCCCFLLLLGGTA